MPTGEHVPMRIALPSGARLEFTAKVVHILTPQAARVLGRHVGMGVEFEANDATLLQLRSFVERLREEVTNPGVTLATSLAVVDASRPLRARLARCFEGAGFVVRAYDSAVAVLEACAQWRPDVIVAAQELDDMSGIELSYAMQDHAMLAQVPLLLTAESPSDMLRLEAYRAGVREVIPRPFLDEELLIRTHRATMALAPGPGVRGSLADIGLPSLLSLFEFERKSGVLLVLAGGEAARLVVVDGRVMRVERGGDGSSRERLLALLDWPEGQFEFSPGHVQAQDEIGMSVTNLLLEHARLQDEAMA